jgi:hypothetical protein
MNFYLPVMKNVYFRGNYVCVNSGKELYPAFREYPIVNKKKRRLFIYFLELWLDDKRRPQNIKKFE